MRKFVLPGAVAATALLAVIPLTAASAAPSHVLTNFKVGGSPVKAGSILKANVRGKATLLVPGTKTGVTCKSGGIKEKVNRNGPSVAIVSFTGQTFSKCTTNIPGATSVKKVQVLGLPYRTTTLARKGHPITVFKLSTKLTLNSVIGTLTCSYKASTIHGTATNVGSLNIFTKQRFRLSSGSAACPKAGDLTATFGPYRNFSVKGHPRIFYNP